MENEISRNESEERFEMQVDGSTAYVEYDLEPDSIVFTHTTVPEELEGRGIGKQLAKHVLEYAKGQNLKVVPQCAFIASYIERNPEYQGLLRNQ